MTAALAKIARLLDGFAEATGRAVAWLTLAMVLMTFAVVVLRYGFNLGWIAMQESITYLHATVFLLGAAYTLKHDGHVRVDIFYQKFGPRGRAWVDLLGTALLLFPVCGYIIGESWTYVAQSWALHEGSGQSGGLPWLYVLKSEILVMAVLMMLQGLALAMHSLLVVLGAEIPHTPHHADTEI